MENHTLFNKNFVLVVIGQIISLFGNAILRFALPLYLLRETNSPSLFGIVTACSFLPMIVLSFVGGVLADRVNKRNIMVILDFITSFVIIIFFILLGKLPMVPLFIVVLMLLYGISGTYQPAVQASIPALVGKDKILSASAIINQISALSGLLGPVIGGMLFGAFGITPILMISIICFFSSAILELFIQMPYQKREDHRGVVAIVKGDLKESIHYIKREKPALFDIIIFLAVANLLVSALIIVGIPVLIVDTLQLSDGLLGIIQGVGALGGLCGGIIAAVCASKLRVRYAYVLLQICCLGLVVMAIPLLLQMEAMASYVVICIGSFIVMVFATIFTVQMMATVQIETPAQFVGKIIAFMMSCSMVAQPIGQALYGIILERCKDSLGMIFLVVAALAMGMSFVSKGIFHKFEGSKE